MANRLGGGFGSIHANRANGPMSGAGILHTPSMTPRGGNSFGRMGIGGGAALIAFSHGRKALESMRYGEIGHTLIHAGIAGGAGYLGYHALTNSNQFRVGAGRLASTLLTKNAKGNGGLLTSAINSTANFLKSMR